MDTKKFLLASLSGFIAMFFLGWIGHEIIIPFFSSGPDPFSAMMRTEPNVAGIAAAYIVLVLIMAYIYPKGFNGESVAGNGLRFGVLIGVLFSLPISIILYSVLEGLTISDIAAETVWHMFEQGIGGIAIALVYGSAVASK